MAAIGTITVYADDGTSAFGSCDFYLANFGEGWPTYQGVNQLDAIVSMGVNFSRFRISRLDEKPFSFAFEQDTPLFDDAITLSKTVRTFKGHLASLSVTASGTVYTFGGARFFILEAMASPRPAYIVSANATNANPLAYVEALLSLQYAGP